VYLHRNRRQMLRWVFFRPKRSRSLRLPHRWSHQYPRFKPFINSFSSAFQGRTKYQQSWKPFSSSSRVTSSLSPEVFLSRKPAAPSIKSKWSRQWAKALNSNKILITRRLSKDTTMIAAMPLSLSISRWFVHTATTIMITIITIARLCDACLPEAANINAAHRGKSPWGATPSTLCLTLWPAFSPSLAAKACSTSVLALNHITHALKPWDSSILDKSTFNGGRLFHTKSYKYEKFSYRCELLVETMQLIQSKF